MSSQSIVKTCMIKKKKLLYNGLSAVYLCQDTLSLFLILHVIKKLWFSYPYLYQFLRRFISAKSLNIPLMLKLDTQVIFSTALSSYLINQDAVSFASKISLLSLTNAVLLIPKDKSFQSTDVFSACSGHENAYIERIWFRPT